MPSTLPPPPPPPPTFYAPYPAPATTTEAPTTTAFIAPYPARILPPAPPVVVFAPYVPPVTVPPPPVRIAPYIPPATVPPPPVRYAPYPAPTTIAPEPVTSRIAPYAAKVNSHYDSGSGSLGNGKGGSTDDIVPSHVFVSAVRAPTHDRIFNIRSFIPKITIVKKTFGFPKFGIKKKFIKIGK